MVKQSEGCVTPSESTIAYKTNIRIANIDETFAGKRSGFSYIITYNKYFKKNSKKVAIRDFTHFIFFLEDVFVKIIVIFQAGSDRG